MGPRAATSLLASDDFQKPDFTRYVNVKRYLDACPSWATTRGTFFQHVRDHARELLGRDPDALYEGVTRRSWQAFHGYPLVEFMRLVHNAAGLVHPGLPLSESFRRLGWLSFRSFAATMSGRVVLFALGERIEDVIKVCTTAYRITLPNSVARVSRLNERRYRIELRNVYSFVDTYHFGVIEGAFVALGHEPRILLRQLSRICDVDFEVAW